MAKLRKAAALFRNYARSRVPPHLWFSSTRIARQAIQRYEASQKIAEFAPLVALVARRRPACVLEIGTKYGGTLWAWCQLAADDATIVSVDLPGGGFGGGDYDAGLLRTYARPAQRLELIRADSHEEATQRHVESVLNGPLDVLFIDGDHTYDGVRSDFDLYSPLVGPGGVVVFHDILDHPEVPECEVHRVWEEVKKGRPHLELLDRGDMRCRGPWGGIGVVSVR